MASSEYNIYKNIFQNYNNNIRPVTSSRIDVLVALHFFTLLYMEQKEELIVFSADFELQWFDPQLVWNPDEYAGRQAIYVPEPYIWKPDVTVYNSVGQSEVLEASRRLVNIRYDGLVKVSNPSVYTSRCRLNVNKFPFDTQTCYISLSSWVYITDELTIYAPKELPGSASEYVGNSEWDILELSVANETTVDAANMTFSELEYKIVIKRRSSYYVFVLLLPTFIVSTISLLGLFTPYDNNGHRVERVTLGLTTLLSLAVMINLVGDEMPKTTKLPQLGSYVLAEIILCSTGVLITIIIQFAHQRIITRRVLTFKNELPKDPNYRRILNSSHGLTENIGKIEKSLQEVVQYLENIDNRETLRLGWVRFFDTIDLFFLILFQITNIILTLCFALIH
ncbi:unnamed protein product [Auanema sp. JU1783]|nr:unnamed protein product [Auanema sp. JU1783]